MSSRRIGWISSLILTVGVAGCGGKRRPEAPPAPPPATPERRVDTLLVDHPSSLETVMAALAARLQAGRPGVVVRRRSEGSVDLVRRATEPSETPDVLAVADYSLIPQLQPPLRASWFVVFARNAMVLAYTDRSAFAADIRPANWTDVLLRPGARVGRADATRDPAGYRAVLLFRLAALHYGRPGLAAALERASTTAIPAPHRTLYEALAAGALDYVITYRSTARVRGFHAVELPDDVNLSDPTRSVFYTRATVGVPLRSGGADSLIRGEPILYGATVPSGARHRALGEQFVRELLSAQGRELLAEWGFLLPERAIERGTLPPAVRPEQ